MSTVIAVCSAKGGVSKSSTCEELAACFNDIGNKVLVIDMDQQCDLTNNSNAKIQNTIHDVFQQNCKISEAIQHTKYYDIIPGSPEFARADIIYADRDDIYNLSDVCDLLKPIYDYIIIDNQPSRSVAITMSYVAADYIIAPTLADDNSLRGIVAIENDLKKMRESRNKESHAYILGLILTMYDKRTMAHTRAYKELEKLSEALEGNVFVETVRESIKVTETKAMKMPLQAYDKYNNVAIDYRRIAKKIEEMINNG